MIILSVSTSPSCKDIPVRKTVKGRLNASCRQHPWPLFLPVIKWHPREVNGEVWLKAVIKRQNVSYCKEKLLRFWRRYWVSFWTPARCRIVWCHSHLAVPFIIMGTKSFEGGFFVFEIKDNKWNSVLRNIFFRNRLIDFLSGREGLQSLHVLLYGSWLINLVIVAEDVLNIKARSFLERKALSSLYCSQKNGKPSSMGSWKDFRYL